MRRGNSATTRLTSALHFFSKWRTCPLILWQKKVKFTMKMPNDTVFHEAMGLRPVYMTTPWMKNCWTVSTVRFHDNDVGRQWKQKEVEICENDPTLSLDIWETRLSKNVPCPFPWRQGKEKQHFWNTTNSVSMETRESWRWSGANFSKILRIHLCRIREKTNFLKMQHLHENKNRFNFWKI